MRDTKTLLIIEDEPAIIQYITASLQVAGWHLLEAKTPEAAVASVITRKPDVILLDLLLQQERAFTLLKELRQWTSAAIILMASPSQEKESAAGIDAGADDFLIKPFSAQELLTRLRFALQRGQQRPEMLLHYDHAGLKIDLNTHRIWTGHHEIHLSPLQYEFLAALVRHAGRVVAYRELIASVWQGRKTITTNYLRVFVFQIRRKIEKDPSHPKLLKTEPYVGYRLEAPPFLANGLLMTQQ